MPPTTPTRSTDGMLGMSVSETRLLLNALICLDDQTGKVDFHQLGARSGITLASARTMYSKALRKLDRLNPGPGTDSATGQASPSAARSPGRPRQRQVETTSATSATDTAEPEGTEH
ncbi:uncharacterized protein N7482_001101 [Penicillium canariense]|uniref:Uncharacterized protein n=1 Tax=Penicillium canariense TaxID=189055 RepID=A0A9W9ICV2_9EURO|nr:uncharacterized protein N7482_001101 [Penicillium canariense]KAJ5175224.1 hypothetical protein N7482_001101 [Penicillium canariense]